LIISSLSLSLQHDRWDLKNKQRGNS
jgi:hypothetical protein